MAGGPEVSYHGEAFLKEEPAVDLVMMGEGEITFAHFLKALLEGEDLKQVPGLMVRNADGTFTDTGFRQVMDMSQIPFPYAFMDMKELEHRIIYYESSRGCPFSCAYCLSSIDKKLRFRSLDLVLPELNDEHVMELLPSQQDIYQTALNTRPEIQSGKLSIDNAKLAISTAKAGYYPSISLSAQLPV